MGQTHKLSLMAASGLLAAALSGCVVAPAPVRVVAPIPPPPGVVVVGPTYPMPAPGYAWVYHPRYGWGWHHPQYGWHREWR